MNGETFPSAGAETFTAAELENSIPFDATRALTGASATNLVQAVFEIASAFETRQRAMRKKDKDNRLANINCLLANIAAAAFNRIDSLRFVAISFNNNAYDAPLSASTMRLLRDALSKQGLLSGQSGFNRLELYDRRFGRLTRLRATSALRDLFEAYECDVHSIAPPQVTLIKMKTGPRVRQSHMLPPPGPEPYDVAASRTLIEKLNCRLRAAQIRLPDDAWKRIAARRTKWPDEPTTDQRYIHRGDLSARSLYRVFNDGWERGGRIYGGWWMAVPKAERIHITIDGEPSTELDFGSLHPRILFAARGQTLDVDPYHLPPYSRECVKETFARLINRDPKLTRRLANAGEHALPAGGSMADLTARLSAHLSPIADLFFKGVGMLLQREDSEIALLVLEELEAKGITVLPIHDSFIVQQQFRRALESSMNSAFHSRLQKHPMIRQVF